MKSYIWEEVSILLFYFSCSHYFCRTGDGELRLGVRRAAQAKTCSSYLAPCSKPLNVSGIVDAVNVISSRNAFNICYNPRYSISEKDLSLCYSNASLFRCSINFFMHVMVSFSYTFTRLYIYCNSKLDFQMLFDCLDVS